MFLVSLFLVHEGLSGFSLYGWRLLRPRLRAGTVARGNRIRAGRRCQELPCALSKPELLYTSSLNHNCCPFHGFFVVGFAGGVFLTVFLTFGCCWPKLPRAGGAGALCLLFLTRRSARFSGALVGCSPPEAPSTISPRDRPGSPFFLPGVSIWHPEHRPDLVRLLAVHVC